MNVIKNNPLKITGYLIASLMLICVSCLKDIGNYTYHDVNSVEIEGIRDSYTRELSGTLKIKPILHFSVDEEASVFEYQWHRIGAVNENLNSGSFTSR